MIYVRKYCVRIFKFRFQINALKCWLERLAVEDDWLVLVILFGKDGKWEVFIEVCLNDLLSYRRVLCNIFSIAGTPWINAIYRCFQRHINFQTTKISCLQWKNLFNSYNCLQSWIVKNVCVTRTKPKSLKL